MGSLLTKLSGKKATKITEHDLVVLQMKQQRDKLNQYKSRLNDQLERERTLAIRLLSEGKRERAKLMLKKKRYQEKLLNKNEECLEQVDMMIHNVEFSQLEAQVVHNLKLGSECLKKLNQLFSLDDIDKIMDETREGAEYQKEIGDLISQNYSNEDESQVTQELNELISSQESMDLPNVPQEPLPIVRTGDAERKRIKIPLQS